MRKEKLFSLVFVPVLMLASVPFATVNKVEAGTEVLSDMGYPFGPGESWQIFQGYNTGSHSAGNYELTYSFDLVKNGSEADTKGAQLIAPISGHIEKYDLNPYGSGFGWGIRIWPTGKYTNYAVQIDHLDGGTISHLSDNQWINKGDFLGNVVTTEPGGIAHFHINIRNSALNDSLPLIYGVWNYPSGGNTSNCPSFAGDTSHGEYCGEWVNSTSNQFFQTMRGTDNGIWTRQNITDTTWGSWQRTGETLSNIDTEEYNDMTVQAIKGTDSLVYTRQYDDNMWHGWDVDGLITTGGDVEMEVFNGEIYQAIRGGNDNVVRTRKAGTDLDFGNWYYGGTMRNAYSKVTMEVHDGKLWQFIRGANDNVFYRSSSDGLFTSGWTQLGTLQVRDDLEAHSYNGVLYVTGRGLANEAYILKSSNGTVWIPTNEGGAKSPIYMDEFEDKLYFTMRGTDNVVYTKMYNSNTGTTLTWNYNTGGAETHAQPTFGQFNGRLFQSIRGTDSRIYTRYTWQDQNWTPWVLHDMGETVGEVSM